MRRDGDLLVEHLACARNRVILCAPFIKAAVLKRLLTVVQPTVSVEIVTRWRAEEIAAGVSDLAVFDIAEDRPGTTVNLLDNLHAKLYASDNSLLVGSANLTATALGWCDDPNVELLTGVPTQDEVIKRFMELLSLARRATKQERDKLQAQVDMIQPSPLPPVHSVDNSFDLVWFPRLAAPKRLYVAYTPSARERLTEAVLSAADHDLAALAITPGLREDEFNAHVADQFSAMPAIETILTAARSDLTDAAGAELVRTRLQDSEMSAEKRWQIIREWLTYFLHQKYEIAPQSFVTRLKPGAGR